MRRVRVVILVLLVLHAVTSDMHEYISNIPGDVGSSVNSAWNNIVKAIKRPVRLRRLGRTGRTKTPRTTPSLSSRYLIKLTQFRHVSTTPRSTTTRSAKLIIPVLLQPSWRKMFEWRNGKDTLKVPGGPKENEKKQNLYPPCELPRHINKMAEDNDTQHYGNLFFV